MKSKIKYKAIDKKTKKVVFEGTLADIRNAAGRLNFTSWEWLEYLKLKDLNGEEIYRGDIVENVVSGERYIIELDNYHRLANIQNYPDTFVVIGNRFENPELVKSI